MSRRLKRIIAIVLAVIMIFSITAMSSYAENEPQEPISLAVCAYRDQSSFVNWWQNEADGKFYVFLPADTDMSKLVIKLGGAEKIKVNDKTISSGKATDAFKKGGEYKITAGTATYSVVFMKSENLPSIHIKTSSGSLEQIHKSKTNKEAATIAVYENGEKTIDSSLAYIKGRGNSTWRLDKKPYNIKFEKKTDLFGMGKAKKWSLIASAGEQSLIRNKSVYELADEVGLKYSSKSQHVDLYINNNYMGNYLVCESVEVGSNRVDITDLENLNEAVNPGVDIEQCALAGQTSKDSAYAYGSKRWAEIPNDPVDISGGYMLEFEQRDRYRFEASGFVSNLGQPIVVKSPEYASKAEVEYISDLYQQFEDAVCSDNGKNSLGKHYSEYIDMKSIARMYLIQEAVMNLDAGTTSFFFCKDSNSDKFIAAPVWDFDYSLGMEFKKYDFDFLNPEHWWACINYTHDSREYKINTVSDVPTVLNMLCRHSDFMELVKKEWKTNFEPKLGDKIAQNMQKLADEVTASAVMDAIRWNQYETSNTDEILKSYLEQVKIVTTFIKKRTRFMSVGFSDKGARVTYDANGGHGVTYDDKGYVIGDSAIIKESAFDSDSIFYEFDSWNSEKDGSGKAYKTGDKINVDSSDVRLYAQWKKISPVKAVLAEFFRYCEQIVKIVFGRFTAAVGK